MAVALKVAVVDPEATLTEAGTVRLAELEDRFTVAPDEALTVTVQVLDPPGDKLAGVHTRLLTVTGVTAVVTVPPVPVIEMPVPEGAAPSTLVTPMDAVLPESVTATVATTPSAMVVAFIPSAMQVYPFVPMAQVTLLPTADNAGPVMAVKFETAAAEYVRVHWRAAGGLEMLEDNERFRVAVPPGATVPEESVKAGWAHRTLLDGKNSAEMNINRHESALFSTVPMVPVLFWRGRD